MIKFQYIIHKETGTVIKYEDWLKKFNNDHSVRWEDEEYHGEWYYKPKEMLFSDDFEIIYNSEFTTDELKLIFNGHQKEDDKLMSKLHKNIYDKEFLKLKYEIEV